MDDPRLTRKQLYNGLTNCGSKYVAARHYDEDGLFGYNVAIALRAKELKSQETDDARTKIIGFQPISFAEYIRIKLPL